MIPLALIESDKRTQLKTFWKSCFVWSAYFSLLKECNHPSFFLQAEAYKSGGAGLAVCFGSDEYIWFPFHIFISSGEEGPAHLNKPEEFSLKLSLIEDGLLLPPSVKVVTSMARCNTLWKIPIAVKLFYYYVSTWIFREKNCYEQQRDVFYIVVCCEF